ncbi:hypothetical protein A5867_002515 [Enterococcus sp. 6D12_DIV0197]|jgi:hypothetical protein|nr:hypothetical protein A5878_002260 [Enterococcus sp. 3G6_DIV0642]OUZ24827.1 hypothetical protein A5867_002515 [Enterococcus sp. 6D12_DIV0197]SDK94620.1 hypothetical protein SAMN05216513_11760 [Enterococcus casseliflavus]STQ31637.1 Uncharacterised protein [Enterococcus casseliflavus]
MMSETVLPFEEALFPFSCQKIANPSVSLGLLVFF